MNQFSKPHPHLYLTEREAQVAELIAAGFDNGQIASELFIEPRTVERHIGAIFSKLKELFEQYPGRNPRVMTALLWIAGEIPVGRMEIKHNGKMDARKTYLRFSSL